MAKIGFTVSTSDGGGADLGDLLVPRDLFSEGGLWGWGFNPSGGLGDSTITNKSSPVQTIAGGTTWKQVSCARYFAAAIKTDGTLWTWGNNTNGILGDSTTTNKSSPVQTIALGTNWKQVACGSFHIAAIKNDGTLWSCGYNQFGQLGDSTISHRSSPTQTITGGNNWKQVSCGQYHTAAIKTDGTLWTWGNNTNGILGDNTTTNKSAPVQTIALGTNWKKVACGSFNTSAIKNDGTLWICGYNQFGQLGDSTITNKSSPVQTIVGGTNWKQVISGGYHIVAIKTDGSLWTWGYNAFGQLADSTTTDKSSPIETITSGYNWKQVSGGLYHTSAIKTDGSLWTWGHNQYGQLGDSTISHRSSPTQTIAGGYNWKQVSCGQYTTSVVKDDM